MSRTTQRLARLERARVGTCSALRFMVGLCEWDEVSPAEQEALKRCLDQLADDDETNTTSVGRASDPEEIDRAMRSWTLIRNREP